MGRIDDRLTELGLQLPPRLVPPEGVRLPFEAVTIRGNRATISGHSPQLPNGQLAPPFGKVGQDISVSEAAIAAHNTALSMLGSLQRSLGTLDRVTGWQRVLGMVWCGPDFDEQPTVINGFSSVIMDVFGHEIGRHSRSAIGVASLPFGVSVEIEAGVVIDP